MIFIKIRHNLNCAWLAFEFNTIELFMEQMNIVTAISLSSPTNNSCTILRLTTEPFL